MNLLRPSGETNGTNAAAVDNNNGNEGEDGGESVAMNEEAVVPSSTTVSAAKLSGGGGEVADAVVHYEAFVADALEAVKLKFVNVVDALDSSPGYAPEFAYQQFGDAEKIVGYRELSVIVCYSDASLFIHPQIHYEAKLPKKAGVQVVPRILFCYPLFVSSEPDFTSRLIKK